MAEEGEEGKVGNQWRGVYREVVRNQERPAIQQFEGAKACWPLWRGPDPGQGKR